MTRIKKNREKLFGDPPILVSVIYNVNPESSAKIQKSLTFK
jgi:hypothetical protein